MTIIAIIDYSLRVIEVYTLIQILLTLRERLRP